MRRNKRALVAVSFALVAVGALAMVARPTPAVVLSSQLVIGMVGATFGPALAAISMGLVGHEGLARRMGRNHALDHVGNVVAAALAGYIGDWLGYGSIFVLGAVMCAGGIIAVSLIRGDEIDYEPSRGGGAEPGGGIAEPMFDKDLDLAPPSLGAKSSRFAALGELVTDCRILIFTVSVVLFHFANAAMLPMVDQKLTTGLTLGCSLFFGPLQMGVH